MTRRSRWALAAWLLAACLNPRPEELPGHGAEQPNAPGPEIGPDVDDGAAGTAATSNDGDSVPIEENPGTTPGSSGSAGAPPDAGVAGDAGTDAAAPSVVGAGAPSTSE